MSPSAMYTHTPLKSTTSPPSADTDETAVGQAASTMVDISCSRLDAGSVPRAHRLMLAFGSALIESMNDCILGELVIEPSPELAQSVWQEWSKFSDHPRKLRDLVALGQLSGDALEDSLDSVIELLEVGLKSDLGQMLAAYLRLLPGCVRQALRRPADPAGKSLPPGFQLQGSNDLLPLLPPRLPVYQPSDRPWGIGDWELVEIVELRSYGEVWKAVNPRDSSVPPVALHFVTDRNAKKHVLGPAAPFLDRVQTDCGKLPGIVPLQRVHLGCDHPCIEYAYVEAATLDALVQQWHETGVRCSPLQICGLMREVARTVGRLHVLDPVLVHRSLRPGSILVREDGAGGWACQLANLGLGLWGSASQSDLTQVSPYCSPEQSRNQARDPRDDVYALGVLWYQLLVGNLGRPRPAGMQWRRELLQRGMPAPLVELLESCFDDDASARPTGAQQLAEAIDEHLHAAQAASAAQPRVVNSVGMRFALIPAGSYFRGSPPREADRRANEGPVHQVTLAKAFGLGGVPVTQRQYTEVMGRNPSRFTAARGGSDEHPVECVSWEDAVAFCQRLSALPAERAAGRRYRLPTEAEWEWACRAGTASPYTFGPTLLATQANFLDAGANAAAQKTSPVGKYPANAFGLADMHGNVWEWCSDWFGAYKPQAQADPPGPDAGHLRVLRGGAWSTTADFCRSATRHGMGPGRKESYIGFRVVLEVVSKNGV